MVLLLKYRTYYSDCRFRTSDTLRLLYNMAPSKRSTGPSLQATAGSLCRWPAQGESCSACGSGMSTEKDCDKGKPAWSAVSSYCPTSEAFRSRYYPWLLGDSCQVNWDYRAIGKPAGKTGRAGHVTWVSLNQWGSSVRSYSGSCRLFIYSPGYFRCSSVLLLTQFLLLFQ